MNSLATYDLLQSLQMLALAVGLPALLLAETLWPSRAGRTLRGRAVHLRRNGGLWLVTSLATSIVFGSGLVYAAYWLEVHRVGVLNLAGAPAWLSIVVGVLALDFADYAFHRMSHEIRWLWLLHAVHHSDDDVDVTTNLRAHPLHVLATGVTKIVVLAAIGIPLWVWLLRELVTMPVTQFHHAAIRLPTRVERLLGVFVVTPAMHRVHHSADPAENNTNFGGLVPWWDRLLRTYADPRTRAVSAFGLPALREARFHSVLGMCATPFAARRLRAL